MKLWGICSGLILINYFQTVISPFGDKAPIGGELDSNNCLISSGFKWCEALQDCIRHWETPCSDNYIDCNDCLLKQRNGQNIACPFECDNIIPVCRDDKECGSNGFCKLTGISQGDNSGVERDNFGSCELYLQEGDTCGGQPSIYEERCHPSLECVHSKSGIRPSVPMVPNSRGICKPTCLDGQVRDAYGHCTGQNEKSPFLMALNEMKGDITPRCNNQCPPPPSCPPPGPDCEYLPPTPNECGCILNCGIINCMSNIQPCPETMCSLFCENGFQIDDNGCNVCRCNTIIQYNPSCDIPYEDCLNEFVCPKVTEITQCSMGGIKGATTYQLSLVIKDENIQNIYAIYGDSISEQIAMVIPPSYQVFNSFGSNIGGTSSVTNRLSPNSIYDSWLTIGITDGDPNNELGTIGIDFSSWDINNPLIIQNGAVFKMDPDYGLNNINEIIIGQLTIPSRVSTEAVINAQGKLKYSPETWKQNNIRFSLSPPQDENNIIPRDCDLWYDGCNTCSVNNGILGYCTKIMCFREDEAMCLHYLSGH
tara:strand:- start:2482 stop:4092 length:1611 start_codon:yes stop_codon:yes gene_type:complete